MADTRDIVARMVNLYGGEPHQDWRLISEEERERRRIYADAIIFVVEEAAQKKVWRWLKRRHIWAEGIVLIPIKDSDWQKILRDEMPEEVKHD